MEKFGFLDISVLFIQHQGQERVRIRGYVYKPGDRYSWLFNKK